MSTCLWPQSSWILFLSVIIFLFPVPTYQPAWQGLVLELYTHFHPHSYYHHKSWPSLVHTLQSQCWSCRKWNLGWAGKESNSFRLFPTSPCLPWKSQCLCSVTSLSCNILSPSSHKPGDASWYYVQARAARVRLNLIGMTYMANSGSSSY